MERLKRFDGRALKVTTPSELKEVLEKEGLKAHHIPEDLEEFDEIEIRFKKEDGKELCFGITIFNKKIQRMMLVKLDPKDPDKVEAPSEEDLKIFSELYIEKLISFLEKVTE